MDDDRRRERVTLQQTIEEVPGERPLTVAAVQPLPPAAHHLIAKPRQRFTVARDPVVREMTT